MEAVPTLKDLARILYFSAGITKRKTYPGGEIFFRAASCTGALYEFELYVVCGGVPDLEPGLYHFYPADFSLRRLRAGDFRSVLVHASANENRIVHAPLTIVCTGTYWRNAWKYRTRTYRHFGWDNGTLLATCSQHVSSSMLPARVVCGFIGFGVEHAPGCGPAREVAFSMIPVGFTNSVVRQQCPSCPNSLAGYPAVGKTKSIIRSCAQFTRHPRLKLRKKSGIGEAGTSVANLPQPQSLLVFESVAESLTTRCDRTGDFASWFHTQIHAARDFACRTLHAAGICDDRHFSRLLIRLAHSGIPCLIVNAVASLKPVHVFHRDMHWNF